MNAPKVAPLVATLPDGETGEGVLTFGPDGRSGVLYGVGRVVPIERAEEAEKLFSSVLESYDLDPEDGTIISPGAFEGEPWWAPVVVGWGNDGGGEPLASMDDGVGEYASLHALGDDAPFWRALFDLVPGAVSILYTCNDSGFHSVEPLTEEEEADVRGRAEEAAGPSQGDYILSPGRGCAVRASVFEGTSSDLREGFDDDEAALRAIRARMDADKFWPNVWRAEERGGWTLLRDPFKDLDTPEDPAARLAAIRDAFEGLAEHRPEHWSDDDAERDAWYGLVNALYPEGRE